MRYFIISGTSSGLGAAIAKELLQEGNQLFCLSRRINEELIQEAKVKQVALQYISVDFNQVEKLERVMEDIFSEIDWTVAKGVYLINNAGMVQPIAPLDRCPAEELVQNIHVDLVAPMLMVSFFSRYSNDYQGEKRVVNISSGAGKTAYAGWSSYCTAKAGVDMLTRCVAVEQQERAHPVEILSFAPGVVDTSMQDEIRATSEEDFIHVERFKALKEQGQLLSAKFVAKEVVRRLLAEDFAQGAIQDIRQ